MIQTIDAYLTSLKEHMAEYDPALVHDALADAEEYLHNSLKELEDKDFDTPREELLAGIIETYGSPEEIAQSYQIVQERSHPALSPKKSKKTSKNLITGFFTNIVEPEAWGALLYCLLSLVTGTLYFSWAVTGISLSIGLSVLIISLPIIGLVLLSFRAFGLLEGRLVEALLGVRMPSRPIFIKKDLDLWEKFKFIISSGDTWNAFLYMILQLPLGVIYFSVIVTVIATGLSFIAVPVFQEFLSSHVVSLGILSIYFPVWSYPFIVIFGILIILLSLSIAKGFGKFHSGLAKSLLIPKQK